MEWCPTATSLMATNAVPKIKAAKAAIKGRRVADRERLGGSFRPGGGRQRTARLVDRNSIIGLIGCRAVRAFPSALPVSINPIEKGVRKRLRCMTFLRLE
jgi:hypothetical protein